jgi:hypothetical protein
LRCAGHFVNLLPVDLAPVAHDKPDFLGNVSDVLLSWRAIRREINRDRVHVGLQYLELAEPITEVE